MLLYQYLWKLLEKSQNSKVSTLITSILVLRKLFVFGGQLPKLCSCVLDGPDKCSAGTPAPGVPARMTNHLNLPRMVGFHRVRVIQ